MEFFKKAAIFIIVGGILYFLLSYHIIITDSSLKLLKKSNLTLKYTIFNAKGKENSTILKIKELYEDGIADLLVEIGKMSEEELEMYKEKREGKSY